MTFCIASWNVNSLRVRLAHVLEWLSQHSPDVLALQEIKMPDIDFPADIFLEAGYHAIVSGQKTYNGVAFLINQKKIKPENVSDIVTDIPGFADPQRRLLGITTNGLRIFNCYVPNGESVTSEKYQYKLSWLKHFNHFLQQELKNHQQIMMLGDFNIAPQAIDVHEPKLWEGQVLFSEQERQALQAIMQSGFEDCFRYLHPEEKSFTWWDYRLNAFKRKMGLRIDHIFASRALAAKCKNCMIDPTPRAWERPSDHAVIMAEFDN